MKVKEAMHQGVEWCDPEISIADIAKVMRDEDVGAVPIGENDKLIGMVTDRDITCRAVANGGNLSKTTAREVMSEGIVYCMEDEDIEDAIHLMENQQIRRVPVISNEKRMIGILSLGDLSHAVSNELSGEFVTSVAAHHP